MFHLMVDSETLGVKSNTAPMIQLAIVPFDPNANHGPATGAYIKRMIGEIDPNHAALDHDDEYWDPVNCYIDLKTVCRPPFNRTIDPDTLMWWLTEGGADLLTEILQKGKGETGVSMHEALNQAEYYIAKFRNAGILSGVWANSPSFDLAMLKDLFSQVETECTWSFRQELDFRTETRRQQFDWGGGFVTKVEEDGRGHDAFVDCHRQIRNVQEAIRSSGRPWGA